MEYFTQGFVPSNGTQTMMDLNLTVKTYATPAQMRCKLDLL